MKGRADQHFRHPGEAAAWAYFKQRGHKLIRHNYHARVVEIDLITLSQDCVLHAVEVKSWNAKAPLVHPLETLGVSRQKKLRHAMRLFLKEAEASRELRPLLEEAGCGGPVQEMGVSFDLLWLKGEGDVEYFEALF